jgi:hypothetical protein
MAILPQELDWDDADNRWAAIIEPIITNPANNSLILKNVALTTGTNVINHKLGRNLQGWNPTRIRGVSATFYDLQDSNQTPQLTLILVSSATVTVDLVVF